MKREKETSKRDKKMTTFDQLRLLNKRTNEAAKNLNDVAIVVKETTEAFKDLSHSVGKIRTYGHIVKKA